MNFFESYQEDSNAVMPLEKNPLTVFNGYRTLPLFEKTKRVFDLYGGRWDNKYPDGKLLGLLDYVTLCIPRTIAAGQSHLDGQVYRQDENDEDVSCFDDLPIGLTVAGGVLYFAVIVVAGSMHIAKNAAAGGLTVASMPFVLAEHASHLLASHHESQADTTQVPPQVPPQVRPQVC
ncbi:MAG TPA: hypothetical protein DDY37_01455 [Legionella sp.]|nr:hypothetical protein [Legionella sp.]